MCRQIDVLVAEPSPARGLSPSRTLVWAQAERARLRGANPGLARGLEWVWQRPVLALTVVGAVLGVPLGLSGADSDAAWFVRAGQGMIGSHFFDVFADPGLQIGSIYLAGVGLWARVAIAVHLPVFVSLGVLQCAALAWLTVALAGRAAALAGARVRVAQWSVGAAIVLGGPLVEVIESGHPEELLLGIMLAAAALLAADRRFVVAGLLVGLATGVKQWGAIGAGVLLRGRRARGVAVGVVVIAAVVAVSYVPFFALGDVETFDMQWGTSGHALLVIGNGTGWASRVVQGALAGVAGSALAWWGKGSPLVAVVVTIAVRLLVDPLRLPHYSVALVVVVLVWMWSSTIPAVVRCRAVCTALVVPLSLAPYALSYDVYWLVGNVAFVAVPVLCVLAEWRGRRPVASAAARTG